MALTYPAGMDGQGFLSEYWQRKPLLLPGGLTGLLPRLTPAELAGLACADEAEARLLLSAGPPTQWQLQHGPFDDEDFSRLPESHWTLLVQDVDKWVPDVATLLQNFDFIPSWRIDDVMISYATAGGTVGPHIDDYDVFLIQGDGSRVWETGTSNGKTVEDLPVRVLEEFAVEQRWELQTGDVLYLPPGLAHHGHGNHDSMTLSVGFRAPSIAELILSQAAFRAEQATGRYQDRDLALHESKDGLISPAAIHRVLGLLAGDAESAADATVWFGQLVTETKPWLQAVTHDNPEKLTEFVKRLENGQHLQKHPGVRMAYSREPAHGMLFVDGIAWPLTKKNQDMAPQLCRGDTRPISSNHNDCRQLLYQLYCDGKLYWADDE